MALAKHRIGLVIRKACVLMMGGSDLAGALVDDKVAGRYEHYAAACQRATAADVCEGFYEMAGETMSAMVAMDPTPSLGPLLPDKRYKLAAIVGIEFKADATNQEALGNSKLHLSTLAASYLSGDSLHDSIHVPVPIVPCKTNGKVKSMVVSSSVRYNKRLCVMQPVTAGATEELFRLVRAGFASVGCPTWEDSCNAAAATHWVNSACGAYVTAIVTCYLYSFWL